MECSEAPKLMILNTEDNCAYKYTNKQETRIHWGVEESKLDILSSIPKILTYHITYKYPEIQL